MTRHLISLLFAVFLGFFVAPLQAQLTEEASAFCDAENDSSQALATLDGACWELDIRCDGEALGDVLLTLSSSSAGDWSFAASDTGFCEESGTFDGTEKVEVKCEFPGGAEMEAEIKSVNPDACDEEEEEGGPPEGAGPPEGVGPPGGVGPPEGVGPPPGHGPSHNA